SRCRLTRPIGDDLPPLLRGHYPASTLLRGSPPLAGASVLSASRLEPLAPFPLASPARFSLAVRSCPAMIASSTCLPVKAFTSSRDKIPSDESSSSALPSRSI